MDSRTPTKLRGRRTLMMAKGGARRNTDDAKEKDAYEVRRRRTRRTKKMPTKQRWKTDVNEEEEEADEEEEGIDEEEEEDTNEEEEDTDKEEKDADNAKEDADDEDDED